MRPDNGTNGNQNPPQLNDFELRRRQQLIRMGLLVCFCLALMDTGGPPPDFKGTSTSRSNKMDLDMFINKQISRLNKMTNFQKYDSTIVFSKYATGIYRGTWKRTETIQHNSSISSNRIALPSHGKFTLQLRDNPIAGVENLTYVYGILQADGLLPPNFPLQSIFFPMQGVYSRVDGSLTLLATPSRSQKLFISLPIISNSTKRASMPPRLNTMKSNDVVSENSLQVEASADGPAEHAAPEPNSTSNHSSSSEEGTGRRYRSLRTESPIDDGRLATPYFLSDDPVIRFNITRDLSPLNVITSNIGSTGVSVAVIPATSLSERAQVQYGLLGGLGEALLSDTFRAYQSRPLFVPSTEKVAPGDKSVAKQPLLSHCLVKTQLTALPSTSSTSRESIDEHPHISAIRGSMFAESHLNFLPSASCSLLSGISVSLDLFDLDGKLRTKTLVYSLVEGAVCILQIYLLILQLTYVQTQAAAAKLSVLGILSHALIDSLQCVLHLLLSNIFNGEYFSYFVCIALLKLVIFGIFEMRLVILVYQSRFAQDLAGGGWNTLRQYLALLHIRFYGCLFAAMIFIFAFQNRPVIVVLVLYSFWVPQIAYNAAAGIRKPFSPLFATGMSVARLFFPLYVLGCPDNLFAAIEGRDAAALSPLACAVVSIWVIAQALLLFLQDSWGPRFFLPSWMFPASYNYERELPLHFIRNNGPEDGELPECVICYNGVDRWQRNYMITPCDHIFHRECLSEWLNHKLECPVCRTALPPADSNS